MRAAVLGRPVAHSLSPRLHRAAYAALDLDWTYDAVEIGEEGLAAFLDALGAEWAGLSLTMPLKTAVLPLLDEVVGVAADVAAVNTVVLRDGRRTGHNTDVAGIVAALAEAGVTQVSGGVVVGGGATAASAVAALAGLGERSPAVLVRSPARAAGLVEAAGRLGVSPRVLPLDQGLPPGCDVVVATAPAGALDDRARALAAAAPGAVLLDVVYSPWPTALAAAWQGPTVSGHAMLLHQAARQVELMTGRPAPVEAMRAALAS